MPNHDQKAAPEAAQIRATTSDFDLVIDAISAIGSDHLKHLFTDPDRLTGIMPVAFDAQNLYLFTGVELDFPVVYQKGGIRVYRLEHSNSVDEPSIRKWAAGVYQTEAYEYLHSLKLKHQMPYGSIFQLFRLAQSRRPGSIYTIPDSYKATIVHEYAHLVFDQRFEGNPVSSQEIKGHLEVSHVYFWRHLSELFANCVELVASQIFWKTHYANMVKSGQQILDQPNPRPNAWADPHMFARAYSQALIQNHPQDWPEVLMRDIVLKGVQA